VTTSPSSRALNSPCVARGRNPNRENGPERPTGDSDPKREVGIGDAPPRFDVPVELPGLSVTQGNV
jgi:hypothetical protein